MLSERALNFLCSPIHGRGQDLVHLSRCPYRQFVTATGLDGNAPGESETQFAVGRSRDSSEERLQGGRWEPAAQTVEEASPGSVRPAGFVLCRVAGQAGKLAQQQEIPAGPIAVPAQPRVQRDIAEEARQHFPCCLVFSAGENVSNGSCGTETIDCAARDFFNPLGVRRSEAGMLSERALIFLCSVMSLVCSRVCGRTMPTNLLILRFPQG